MPASWLGWLDAKGWAWAVHRMRGWMGLLGPVPRPVLLSSRFDHVLAPERFEAAIFKPPRLKVLVFSHNLRSEGASISLKELVVGLARANDIAIEIVAFEDGPLRAAYESLGIPVALKRAVHHRIWTLTQLKSETERLAAFIRQSKAQAVLANTLLCFPAILAAERAGLPSVWIPRESEPWDAYFRFLPDAVAQQAIAAIGLPRRVVFVADTTRTVWQSFDNRGRFVVVHNALDTARFSAWLERDRAAARAALGWEVDETVFLCIGTICERKGQEDAIDALDPRENNSGGRLRLVFVGDASSAYAQRLKQRTRHWSGSSHLVDFIDPTLEIGHFYRAADVFLLCSRVESFPRVTLEAMAFGLPVIATPVFGVTEQLQAPADACFYAPGDVKRLREHAQTLAREPQLRAYFGERSRSALARLPSFDAMCARYREVLGCAAREDAAQPP